MAIRVFKLGGAVTDTVADLAQGSARMSVGARHSTFEAPVGTGYQVASGKTLYISRLIVNIDTANHTVQLGYGDTAVADSASAPTAPVFISEELSVGTPLSA